MAMTKKKLCALVKKGALKDDLAEYQELLKGAKYVCRKCGRASAHPRNLCKPSRF